VRQRSAAAPAQGWRAPATAAARGPLQPKGIQPHQSMRPVLQVPVVKHIWQRPNEVGPGLSGVFGKYFLRVANFLIGPEPTNTRLPVDTVPVEPAVLPRLETPA
jgi:hypothetical protein